MTLVRRSRRLGVVRFPVTWILVLVEDESPDAHIPQRIARPRMREMAEGHRGHRRVPAQRRFEWLRDRWLFAVDPELLVKALHQLPGRRQPPRELREDLVLFVDPREFRVSARLAIVIALILVSREEPQPIADNRAAKVQREVAVSGARIPALLHGVRNIEPDGLAGQSGRLSVVRRVVEKPRAPLLRDHIDHSALHVAELGGRADGLNLYLLNEVDPRLGARHAVARAGRVRTVDEELILVGAGAEC